MSGENATKQRCIETVAQSMGYDELSLFKFPDSCDSDYELNVRMEGIMAAMENEAVVIFQYPSMVSLRYDRSVVQHIKKYADSKLIIMVQDFGSVVSEDTYPSLEEEVALLQQADLLILQSPMMRNCLIQHGLKEIPILYQQVWEYPYDIYGEGIKIKKSIHRIENVEIQTLLNMRESGVAVFDSQGDYYKELGSPLATGFCICAGIPILTSETSALGQFVRTYGIGFTLSEEQRAESFIEQLTDAEISDKVRQEQKLKAAIGSGLFTKTLLQNAVFQVYMDKYSG